MSELLSAPVDGLDGATAAELLPEGPSAPSPTRSGRRSSARTRSSCPWDGDLPSETVSAWVGIDGPWRGRVVLTCSTSAAEELTRALLRGRAPAVLDAEDVEDGFGELANVSRGPERPCCPRRRP